MAGTPGTQDSTYVDRLRKLHAQISDAMLAPDADEADMAELQQLQAQVSNMHRARYQAAQQAGMAMGGMTASGPMGAGAGGQAPGPNLNGGFRPAPGPAPAGVSHGPSMPSGGGLASILSGMSVGA